MMRGTFANIRIKNFMLKGADGNIPEGGLTRHWPDGEQDVDLRRRHEVPAGARAAGGVRRRRIRQRLLARLGREGHASARRARRVCQSFERIHRSNLVGMGVLPLTFEDGASWQSIGLRAMRR